jgi:hypothetical protein
VLGVVLFLIFINDIDINIVSMLSKFADDFKAIRQVQSTERAYTLQEDITKLYCWSNDWQMLFHPDKCKCMHIGYNNLAYDYYLGDTLIKSVADEKDLGVVIQNNLSPSKHISEIVKKANRKLGTIRRTYTFKSKKNIMSLYKTLVRPTLDFASSAWSPHQLKDINKLEKVQKRATRMIGNLRKKPYQQRLRECHLMTLENRRRRYDLLETFKIMKRISDVDYKKLFVLRNGPSIRGHSMKLQKQYNRLDVRKHFFSQRVIDDWNKLPQAAVDAITVDQFKKIVDPMFRNRGGLYNIQ